MSIKFSIITVCYNEETTIESTIESVIKQKWEDYEYIIVDGASTDRTSELVSNYILHDTRIKWYSEPDKGIYNAMNKGISFAKGEYLFFLNAGDVFHSDEVLKNLAETIDLTSAEIIIGNMADKKKDVLFPYQNVIGEELKYNLAHGKSICHQAIFAARDCLTDGFDETYILCADYDWLCKMVSENRTFAKNEGIIVDFDVLGVSRQIKYLKLLVKESIYIVDKYFPNQSDHLLKYELSKENKYRIMYEMMNKWLEMKQQGIHLSQYFQHMNYKKVAIYGMHYMGQRLFQELNNSSITVAYAIDRSPAVDKINITIYSPKCEYFSSVDAIVITPIFDYFDIKEELENKIRCAFLSVEDLLNYQYYDDCTARRDSLQN